MTNQDLILNWGIIGSGQIVNDFSTALLSLKSEKHKICAVYDRVLADAQRLANKFAIETHTDSLDEFLTNININIVYIGTVNQTHKEFCLRAIEAGKHVLCEKPMSISRIEQEEVLKAAKEKNVFFMEGLWSRFFPVVHKIKEDLKNKEIGELKYFIGSYLLDNKDVERIKKKELGGGGILEYTFVC